MVKGFKGILKSIHPVMEHLIIFPRATSLWLKEPHMVNCPVNPGLAVKHREDAFVTYSNFGIISFPVCMFTWIRIIHAKMRQGSDGVKTGSGDFIRVNNFLLKI